MKKRTAKRAKRSKVVDEFSLDASPQKRAAGTRNRRYVTRFVEGFMSGYMLGIFDASDGVVRAMDKLESRARIVAGSK